MNTPCVHTPTNSSLNVCAYPCQPDTCTLYIHIYAYVMYTYMRTYIHTFPKPCFSNINSLETLNTKI